MSRSVATRLRRLSTSGAGPVASLSLSASVANSGPASICFACKRVALATGNQQAVELLSPSLSLPMRSCGASQRQPPVDQPPARARLDMIETAARWRSAPVRSAHHAAPRDRALHRCVIDATRWPRNFAQASARPVPPSTAIALQLQQRRPGGEVGLLRAGVGAAVALACDRNRVRRPAARRPAAARRARRRARGRRRRAGADRSSESARRCPATARSRRACRRSPATRPGPPAPRTDRCRPAAALASRAPASGRRRRAPGSGRGRAGAVRRTHDPAADPAYTDTSISASPIGECRCVPAPMRRPSKLAAADRAASTRFRRDRTRPDGRRARSTRRRCDPDAARPAAAPGWPHPAAARSTPARRAAV